MFRKFPGYLIKSPPPYTILATPSADFQQIAPEILPAWKLLPANS
jgi:hypothetical protein